VDQARVRLRPLRPDDIPVLVEVFVEAFRHGYPDVLPPDVLASVTPITVAGWFARWTDELTTTVAEQDGDPVGFVRYGDDDDDPDPRAGYIAALYVHPDASGMGIGRMLLRHAVGELAGRGQRTVTLWVFRDNQRARRLYTGERFVPDGTEVTDPQWRAPQIRLRRQDPPHPFF
jgi:ribosomal protein S18 acetylase RimI-like enzyme